MKTAFILTLFISFGALASTVSLTVQQYDSLRNRVAILVHNDANIPMGTNIRVHSRSGTCVVKVLERVNSQIIGGTQNCPIGTLNSGMKLSFSFQQPQSTEDWIREPAYTGTSNYEDDSSSDTLALIRDRISVYMGLSTASNIEGKVYSDGRLKNLEGDSAFSLGINGNIYKLSPKIGFTLGLGYESTRTFERGTKTQNGGTVTEGFGHNPRLSMWTITSQIEGKPIEKLNVFGGLNFAIPNFSNSPIWSMSGDLGFQAGAAYEVYPNVDLEALVEITNLNLKNEAGETTDVSLNGLELRARYRF